MDPVSAFGLAASVVQFIDFTEALLRGTYQIYKHTTTTGDTKSNLDLITLTKSLETLSDELQLSDGHLNCNEKSFTKREMEIYKICEECSKVAEKLISTLEKLKAEKHHDLWNSFRMALRTYWSKGEIESLEKRLTSFRMHISLQINAALREEIAAVHTAQSSQGHLISRSIQIVQEFHQSLLEEMDQNAIRHQQVIDTISLNTNSRSHGSLTIWDRNDLISRPETRLNNEFTKLFCQCILKNLKFDDMSRRSHGISSPFPKTFEWIYRSSGRECLSSDFVAFLEQQEQNLFWITGKPASGKSTLMKMISDDSRTIRHLKVWASKGELFVSRFYFWCSGTEMQMSQEGLLRTLLYEALRKHAHLAATVFPDRMENFVLFGNGYEFKIPWDMAELLEAYKNMVLKIVETQRMFILIDGLDEFHGEHSEQLKLIELLYSLLSLSSNVKICVSSRPWNVFADAFETRPSLRLEDLTYPDIQHYVSTTLSTNPGFLALQEDDPSYVSVLVDNVSTKASGVFLWVVLVIHSLLQGLTDGDRLSDLQRRLDSLPPDLETLFMNILKSVNFKRASQLIQIVEKFTGQESRHSRALTVIELYFADEDDPEFVFRLQIPTAHQGPRSFYKAELMRRRLNACTKGLLELQKQDVQKHKVEYLHRTVRDFIQRTEIWNKLLEATPAFDPAERLSISALACFKFGHSRDERIVTRVGTSIWDWESVIATMTNIHSYGTTSTSLLLNELDRTVQAMFDQRENPYENCPLRTQTDRLAISSFLHLAVKLQLDAYVKPIAVRLHHAGEIAVLSDLFQVAATEYQTPDFLTFRLKTPSISLIELFLDLGISPNQRLQGGTPGHQHVDVGATIWRFVISDSASTSEMLKLFLRHGADPFVSELDSVRLGQGQDEFRQILLATRTRATENRSKWDTTESAGKTASAWSRIRRQKPPERTKKQLV